MYRRDKFAGGIVFFLTVYIIFHLEKVSNKNYVTSTSQTGIAKTMATNKSFIKTQTGRNIMSDDTIHFATIVGGKYFYNKAFILIKSILFTTKKNINFYIFTKDNAVDRMLFDMKPWPTAIRSRLNLYELEKYTESGLHFPRQKNGKVDIKMLTYAAIMHSKIIAKHTSKLIYIDADTCVQWMTFGSCGKCLTCLALTTQ